MFSFLHTHSINVKKNPYNFIYQQICANKKLINKTSVTCCNNLQDNIDDRYVGVSAVEMFKLGVLGCFFFPLPFARHFLSLSFFFCSHPLVTSLFRLNDYYYTLNSIYDITVFLSHHCRKSSPPPRPPIRHSQPPPLSALPSQPPTALCSYCQIKLNFVLGNCSGMVV